MLILPYISICITYTKPGVVVVIFASVVHVQVNIVDPLKLTEEFGNILANPIIATRVVATFIIHKGLYVCPQFLFFFFLLSGAEYELFAKLQFLFE